MCVVPSCRGAATQQPMFPIARGVTRVAPSSMVQFSCAVEHLSTHLLGTAMSPRTVVSCLAITEQENCILMQGSSLFSQC